MDPKHLASTKPIRVLLVDDHPAVRQGLTLLLSTEGISVCAEAEGRSEVLARVSAQRPDLAIVDLSLDGEDGLGVISELHEHRVPALVYSMHHDARHVGGAFAAGALGYVTKREFDDVLLRGIREVAVGRRFVSPKAAAALAEDLAGAQSAGAVSKLSLHERKVYELLGQWKSTFEIAASLNVSTHTVESYYERIKVKLSLNGMQELRRNAAEYLQEHAR